MYLHFTERLFKGVLFNRPSYFFSINFLPYFLLIIGAFPLLKYFAALNFLYFLMHIDNYSYILKSYQTSGFFHNYPLQYQFWPLASRNKLSI